MSDSLNQRQAGPLHLLIVCIFGILALACIAAGIVAIIYNSKSETDFSIFGVHLSTGHVGVALIGTGVITMFFTIRTVLKSQTELAKLNMAIDGPIITRRNPSLQNLSQAEHEMLAAAAQSGELLILRVEMYGSWIRAGQHDFFDQQDPAMQAKYLEAFDSLRGRGYVRLEGGTLYRLTGMGFDIARKIAAISDSIAEVTIHTATYGAGEKFQDVSEYLRKEVAKGHKKIPVGNSLLTGGPDPFPNVKKTLTVEYSVLGKRQKKLITEDGQLILA